MAVVIKVDLSRASHLRARLLWSSALQDRASVSQSSPKIRYHAREYTCFSFALLTPTSKLWHRNWLRSWMLQPSESDIDDRCLLYPQTVDMAKAHCSTQGMLVSCFPISTTLQRTHDFWRGCLKDYQQPAVNQSRWYWELWMTWRTRTNISCCFMDMQSITSTPFDEDLILL